MPPREVIFHALGLGVLLPAAVAALVLLPLRLRPGLGDRAARLLGGLAVAYAPIAFLKVLLGGVLLAAAAKTMIPKPGR